LGYAADVLGLQPARGGGDGERDDDDTSFEPAQASWGPDRADWDNIVDARGRKVLYELKPPTDLPKPPQPTPWIHDGLVLLDQDNHPVRHIPGLNRAFSSELESFRIEALKRLFPQTIMPE